MKKLWRILLTSAVMSLLVCLMAGTTVFAEKESGKLSENCTWEVDTETGTLTFTGKSVPILGDSNISDENSWLSYEKDIRRLYLDGAEEYHLGMDYGMSNVEFVSGQYGTISWEMDLKNRILKVDGTGFAESMPWNDFVHYPDLHKPYEVTLGDGITGWKQVYFEVDKLYIGAGYSDTFFGGNTIIASPDNPYYSTYDGSVYTKGYEKLIYYAGKSFYPDVKVIGTYSIGEDFGEPIILPWGVTTIEQDGVAAVFQRPTVIVPNTVTSMQQTGSGGRDCSEIFVYSQANKWVDSVIGGVIDNYGRPIAMPVDSLAEYYPDVPEAQGSAFAPESSQPPVSQPESSQNASTVSQPESSRPSSNSSTSSQTPTTPSSQSSTSSVTSSQPVSKPASEPTLSSQPEESSVPEESSAVSEEPSSEGNSSEPESSSPEESELSEPSAPAEQSGSFSSLWPVFLALGAAVVCAGVVIFLIWRKK